MIARPACLILGLAAALHAQQFNPHVGYVYPAGGRQGATFEVTLGGQFLDGAVGVFVSGTGVWAKVVEHVKPLPPAQFNKLREQVQELAQKKSAGKWTPEDEKLAADIRTKLASAVRRPASPAIAEIVRLQVTVAPDAAPGERELRLATPNGLTNPLVFCVGRLQEFSESPAKVIDELGPNPVARLLRNQPPVRAPEGPTSITLPAVVNGQITPGSVDRYRFQASQGQQLVIAAQARELIPYISDAVPGWFQATLALYDSKGAEVAYDDDYRFHPDPVLHYEVPAGGDYVLEIKDAIYRGREDFVYRVTVGELPFITSLFPLGGKAGARTAVEVKGWNLPVARLTPDFKGIGVHPISVGESNLVPFATDNLAERPEQEPNNQAKSAQRLKLPVIVNGRIAQAGDWDVFRFDGRAGEEVVAEVFARRLDSPLDSILKLTDAAGRQLAANDDHEDRAAGLLTHHADSRIRVRLPAKGTYYLQLGDTQRKGGAEYAYRLRIGPPQPDFELRVVPSSIHVRAGAAAAITVYALRKDFTGEIALRLKDAPRGFALSGGWIPPDQDRVRLTVSVPPARIDQPLELRLEGRAAIQGREVVRPGVPAEDMMQAFAYRHLVPARECLVRVAPPGRIRVPWKLLADKPVRLPAGGTAPVELSLPLGKFAAQLQFILNEPPEGIAIQKVSPAGEGLTLLLSADAAKVKPGLRGNLIVEAFPAAGPRRQALATLPAIPFEVVKETGDRRNVSP